MAFDLDPRPLGDGLVLRRATADDVDQIVALSLEAHGDQERWGLRYVTDRYGVDAWTVVTDGDRVVSTCMLMAHELEIGPTDGVSVTVPAGQVEYVATDPDHQRRGLVRAQFDAHHEAADERGDLVLFVAGIPYFYRALGYSYGVSNPTVYRIIPDTLRVPDGWVLRPADPADRDAIAALHDRALDRADLRIRRSPDDWRALLGDGTDASGQVHVASRDGEVRGWMRYAHYEQDDLALVVQAGCTDLTAAEVLVHDAVRRADGTPLYVLERTGDPLEALLRSIAHPADDFNAVFTRIPDPLRFLKAIRPVLDDRLSRSVLAAEVGEITMSLYTRSIRIAYDHGRIVDLSWAPGVEDPDGQQAVGVPDDAFAPLVLGRFGASALGERVDDVIVGRHRALLDVLFPRLVADVIGVL